MTSFLLKILTGLWPASLISTECPFLPPTNKQTEILIYHMSIKVKCIWRTRRWVMYIIVNICEWGISEWGLVYFCSPWHAGALALQSYSWCYSYSHTPQASRLSYLPLLGGIALQVAACNHLQKERKDEYRNRVNHPSHVIWVRFRCQIIVLMHHCWVTKARVVASRCL